MSYIKSKDLNIYYEEIGQGNPVIFIHGSLSRGCDAFQMQRNNLGDIREIYVDLRGHGNTKSNSLEWNSPQLADDIIAFIDSMKIEKACLVGHSMGGDIVMYCAIKYPERVTSIISISSAGAVNESITSFLERFEPNKIDRVKYQSFIDAIQENHFNAHKGDWQAFLNQTIYNCKTYPNFTDEDLQKITCPFLLIYGDQDNMVKGYEITNLEANIPHIQRYVIKNAKHFPHSAIETYIETNKVIFDFICDRQIK